MEQSHTTVEFKRDLKELPSDKRVGALPDSVQGAASKARLGGKSAADIEFEVTQLANK